MATDLTPDLPAEPGPDVATLRRNWGWLLALGIVQILAGFMALVLTVAAAYITVVVIGFLAIVGAVGEVLSVFWARRWEERLLHLMLGVLYGAFGVLILANPGLAIVTLTLILAVMLIVGGMFRVAVAAAGRFDGWGWAVVGGLVSILLGVLIWAGWPESSLWVIGVFVGIDLIFMGWMWVAVALALRKVSPGAEYRRDVPPIPAG